MRLFTCTDHDGHYPVGVASIILAPDPATAKLLLRVALREKGLDPNKPFTLSEIRTDKAPFALIHDGDY